MPGPQSVNLLWPGDVSTVATGVTVAGTLPQKLSPCFNTQGQHTLTLQGVFGGTGSTTCTAQVQASLDGVNFFNVGTALTLTGTATGGATLDLSGLAGAILQITIATLTLGTGATSASFLALLG